MEKTMMPVSTAEVATMLDRSTPAARSHITNQTSTTSATARSSMMRGGFSLSGGSNARNNAMPAMRITIAPCAKRRMSLIQPPMVPPPMAARSATPTAVAWTSASKIAATSRLRARTRSAGHSAITSKASASATTPGSHHTCCKADMAMPYSAPSMVAHRRFSVSTRTHGLSLPAITCHGAISEEVRSIMSATARS